MASVTRPGASNIGMCPTPSSSVIRVPAGSWPGKYRRDRGAGNDSVLSADHQVRGDGGVRQLQQSGHQQRFAQQLEVGGAVLESSARLEFIFTDPVRRSADGQGGELAADGQPQQSRPEQAGQRPERQPTDELGDHLEFGRGPAGPAAGRRDAGDRACPAATFQLEGHPSAQGVADDVAGIPAQLVKLPFDVVGQQRRAQEPSAGARAAVVAGHCRSKHLVAAGIGQLRCHFLPHQLRDQEGVQQQHRFA